MKMVITDIIIVMSRHLELRVDIHSPTNAVVCMKQRTNKRRHAIQFQIKHRHQSPIPNFSDNSFWSSDAYMRQYNILTLLHIMACSLFGAKPSPEPMLPHCQLGPNKHNSVTFSSKFKSFYSRKCSWKWRLWNGDHFCLALNELCKQY